MPDSTEKNTTDQMVSDPSSQLFASLADFYRDNGLIPEAIAICQAGLESQPDNSEGRLVMAKCLLATKQFALARAEAVKVLSVHSENSEAKKILAQADSAVPEAQGVAAPPVKAEAPVLPESLPQAKKPVEPALPEIVPKEEIPIQAPAKIPDALAREMPVNHLPLLSERPEPQSALIPVPKSIPIRQDETPPAESSPGLRQDLGELSQAAQSNGSAPAQAQAQAQPAIPDRPPKPVAEETSEWQAGFGKIMSDLVQTPQVKACMLVDEAGYMVADAVSRTGQSLSEDTAALSTNIFKTASQALQKIKLGQLERIVIETGDEKIFLRQAGRMVLMISADSSAKVGLVMVNSRRAAEQAENLTKRDPNR
jgi:predicted regulator of Ras-like GTPase activity (Roadblock/LC7/MglB family)